MPLTSRAPLRGRPQPTGPNGFNILIIIIVIIIIIIITNQPTAANRATEEALNAAMTISTKASFLIKLAIALRTTSGIKT
jgi:hypothetical protein